MAIYDETCNCHRCLTITDARKHHKEISSRLANIEKLLVALPVLLASRRDGRQRHFP